MPAETGSRKPANSQELDKESGYYFYNARHYDPEIARFVTADTVIDGELSTQGWNRFAYVHNNPIRYKDPTGHKLDDCQISPVGGGAKTSALNAVTSSANQSLNSAKSTSNNNVANSLQKANDKVVNSSTFNNNKITAERWSIGLAIAIPDIKIPHIKVGKFEFPGATIKGGAIGQFRNIDFIKDKQGKLDAIVLSKTQIQDNKNESAFGIIWEPSGSRSRSSDANNRTEAMKSLYENENKTFKDNLSVTSKSENWKDYNKKIDEIPPPYSVDTPTLGKGTMRFNTEPVAYWDIAKIRNSFNKP